MAPDQAENWQVVGEIVGAVLSGIALTFLTIYNRAKKETSGEDLVQRSVGAAFVDRTTAQNIARTADNTEKMLDIMSGQEDRIKENEMLRKLEEKFAQKKD